MFEEVKERKQRMKNKNHRYDKRGVGHPGLSLTRCLYF